MLTRAFYAIAGIDAETMSRCPMTDKIWAAQLGASLLASTTLTFLIALHSVGYIPVLAGNMPLKVLVAGLIALIVFLLDRGLFQSDWFKHGYFRHANPVRGDMRFVEILLRAGVRVSMSVVLALVLASFLELAMYSDAIVDRLEKDNRSVNAPYLSKMKDYRADQEAQAASQRTQIADLQKQVNTIASQREGLPLPADNRLRDVDQQQDRLQAREQQVLADIRTKETEISGRKLEVICESEGTKPDVNNPNRCSGVPKCGPRCRTALRLVKVHEAELQDLQRDLESVRVQFKSIAATKDTLLNEIKSDADARRGEMDQRRRDLGSEIERKQGVLIAFEAGIPGRIESYEKELKRAPGYVAFRDDPLMRLGAFRALKADPVSGPEIAAFALRLKLVMILLEVMPVLLKMLMAPPSAYAIHIQKRVERHQRVDLDADAAAGVDGNEDGDAGGGRAVDAGQPDDDRAASGRRHLTIVR